MATLTVGLSRQTAGVYRFASPVKHSADWISPFITVPHDVNSPDFKKITIADESGRVKERHFKIIDTAHFTDPITLDNDWPTDDADVTRDMRILSCCHTAIKVDSLIQTFGRGKDKCPCCRREDFINELGDPIPVPAPAAPTTAHPVGVLSDLLARIGRTSIIVGTRFTIASLAIAIPTLLFNPSLPLAGFAISYIFTGTGSTLVGLSRLNPHDALNVKIRNIARPLIRSALKIGLGTFCISIIKYSLLTSALAGTVAITTTLALAVLYARFMR